MKKILSIILFVISGSCINAQTCNNFLDVSIGMNADSARTKLLAKYKIYKSTDDHIAILRPYLGIVPFDRVRINLKDGCVNSAVFTCEKTYLDDQQRIVAGKDATTVYNTAQVQYKSKYGDPHVENNELTLWRDTDGYYITLSIQNSNNFHPIDKQNFGFYTVTVIYSKGLANDNF